MAVQKKMIGEVRSIDPEQVPTDINMMGVLKEAMKEEESVGVINEDEASI